MTRRHLIAALDVAEAQRAVDLAAALRDHTAMVKIGLEGFVAHGPDLVRRMQDVGAAVFLDLKLHDIPRTVHAAIRSACRLGVHLLTIHAAGGADMIKAAVDARTGSTQIVAVTILTSLDEPRLRQVGFDVPVAEAATRLGALAVQNGVDGLVCSAHELAALASLGGVRVVPGVRPAGSDPSDQRRIATPADAVRGGATWIVVGRPIVQAADPVAAAAAIQQEIVAAT